MAHFSRERHFPMRWQKLGKLFDPKDHELGTGCRLFAQSPQALVFDDFVRIYFSTRSVDSENGKFISHIRYVDMSKDLTNILNVSADTVIPLGGLGAFDEHGIFPANILRLEHAVYAYTCGWNRRVSVPVDTAIGLAISDDQGKTFKRFGEGPILGPSLQEPFLVGDAFVLHAHGNYHMWYIFGTKWLAESASTSPERVYKIGHATSPNGIDWTKEEGIQIISDSIGENECQALPCVIQIEGLYHMFFCFRFPTDFRTKTDRGYRLGHAWSADLITWTRNDEDMNLAGTSGEWDSDMQCYPHAFRCNDKVYLLYNGNSFGRDGFGAAELLLPL
jgi:hypothetical protein